jgi:hypothetical protein
MAGNKQERPETARNKQKQTETDFIAATPGWLASWLAG